MMRTIIYAQILKSPLFCCRIGFKIISERTDIAQSRSGSAGMSDRIIIIINTGFTL